MEKSLINQQEFTVIKMDILGKSVTGKSKFCRKRVNQIKRKISEIVGLDKRLIEMIKPRAIPKGLRLECYLYVSNKDSTENKYSELFEEAKSNGTLSQCIYQSWKLSAVPNIINLKIKEIKSSGTERLMSESIQMGEVNNTKTKDDEIEDNFDEEVNQNNTKQKASVPRALAVNDSMIDVVGEDDQDVVDEMEIEMQTKR